MSTEKIEKEIEKDVDYWMDSSLVHDPFLALAHEAEVIRRLFRYVRDGNADLGNDKATLILTQVAQEMEKNMNRVDYGVINPDELAHYMLMSAVVNRVWRKTKLKSGSFIEKWIELLSSGKYQQAKGQLMRTRKHLSDSGVGYCCLGVLCDAYLGAYWDKTESFFITYNDPIIGCLCSATLPRVASSVLFGKHRYIEDVLTVLNDTQLDVTGEYGLVIAFLESLPEPDGCGLLFGDYETTIRVLDGICALPVTGAFDEFSQRAKEISSVEDVEVSSEFHVTVRSRNITQEEKEKIYGLEKRLYRDAVEERILFHISDSSSSNFPSTQERNA